MLGMLNNICLTIFIIYFSVCLIHVTLVYKFSLIFLLICLIFFQDCIALTLTLLSSYVSKASLYSEKFNFMCSYYCYVVLLLKNLKMLHQTGNYIMREILLRLMYFLEDDCNEEENFRISMICFDLLESILNMAIQFSCIIEEMSKLIYFIVLKLTDFLKENNAKSEHSKKVLSLLILKLPELEGAEEIRRSISSLDFFLDDLNLHELNQKLLLLKQDQNPAFEKEVCFFYFRKFTFLNSTRS